MRSSRRCELDEVGGKQGLGRFLVSIRTASSLRLGLILIFIGTLLNAQVLLGVLVSPEVTKVSEHFVCQCGCNHQLSVCSMLNCGSATPLRAEIGDLLQQGKTEEQIVSIFSQKYGKVILSAPTTRGFDLTAWILRLSCCFWG